MVYESFIQKLSGKPGEGIGVTETGVTTAVSSLTWELGAKLGASVSACSELLSHRPGGSRELSDPDSVLCAVMDVDSAVENCGLFHYRCDSER